MQTEQPPRRGRRGADPRVAAAEAEVRRARERARRLVIGLIRSPGGAGSLDRDQRQALIDLSAAERRLAQLHGSDHAAPGTAMRAQRPPYDEN
jgi:hypothetical protein